MRKVTQILRHRGEEVRIDVTRPLFGQVKINVAGLKNVNILRLDATVLIIKDEHGCVLTVQVNR